ncbi:MAG: ester cyclase [Bacteroidetes bacterium]|nr:ester cyclase [Bacteroidota bacterium]
MKNEKEIVTAFYNKCLTVNNEIDLQSTLNELLADDFQSINAKETKGKAQLIGQIGFFWKLIPNLKWQPQEILQEGNKLVVRSLFSGSPNGEFMGIQLDGSKSFETMSIDIHTIENGQIKTVYHLEEWATAIAQLKS